MMAAGEPGADNTQAFIWIGLVCRKRKESAILTRKIRVSMWGVLSYAVTKTAGSALLCPKSPAVQSTA